MCAEQSKTITKISNNLTFGGKTIWRFYYHTGPSCSKVE